MKVKILFFGATADAVGEREVEFEIKEKPKADQAFEEVLEEFPRLKKDFGKTLLFSVNEEYAKGDEVIDEGDELGIFTAVSGG